jgi:hypothetical protein
MSKKATRVIGRSAATGRFVVPKKDTKTTVVERVPRSSEVPRTRHGTVSEHYVVSRDARGMFVDVRSERSLSSGNERFTAALKNLAKR